MMRKRRGKQEGSVFQRSDGKWVAQISRQTLSGDRKRLTKLAISKQQAMILLRELQAENPEQYTQLKNLTVSTYLLDWLQSVKQGSESATYSACESVVRLHIIPHIGLEYVLGLTAKKIEAWLQELQKNEVGDRTRQMSFTTLRNAMNNAIRRGIVTRNPCAGIPTPKYTREDINPFTSAEVTLIANETKDDRLACVYLLGLHAAMRQEEIFGLRWRDVDLEVNSVDIRQVVVEVGGQIESKEPKTKAGKRKISVTSATLAALRDRLKAAKEEGFTDPDNYVIPSIDGTPMRRSNFRQRHWKPLLKKLGLVHRGFIKLDIQRPH